MEGEKDWIGKKIFVVLKTNRRYSGRVTKFENNMIHITDKFNVPVMFNLSEVSSMEVEDEKYS